MEPAFNIVFFGETLPGYDRVAARRQLQALLKCSSATIDGVFSGQRVGLRKGLSAIEAERYQLRMKGIGLQVVIDPPLPPDPLDMHITTVSFDDPAESSPVATEDHVLCPACGARQPRRTLCQACGVNMPGFLAAERAKAEQAHGTAAQAPLRAWAAEGSSVEFSGRQDVNLLGVDFDGRCGRGLFAQTHLVAATLLMLAAMPAISRHGTLPLLVALGLASFLLLRVTVKRCHDLGWRGWMGAAQLVPLAGLYVSFKLWLWPGQDGENRWGALRPSRVSRRAFALTAVAFLVALPLAAPVARQHARSALDGAASGDAEADFRARYDARRDRIVMYSLSACEFCAEKRQTFERLGVHFAEFVLDTDEAAAGRLDKAMRRAGLPLDATGTPIIEVNGTLLPNNPDLATMRHYLMRRRG